TDTCIITVEEVPVVVTISDVTVKVDSQTGKVTVEGKVSSGSGNEVTIQVFDPEGNLDYIGQTTSVEDGKFRFEFTPRTGASGTYSIRIGAAGVKEPYEDEFEYEYEAFVPVTGVSLDIKEATLKVGQILQLTATVEPENATNQEVTWSSSDESVATVENGIVTAVGAGTATITVTTVDGGLTDTCIITVEETPIEVTIENVTIEVDSATGKVIIEGKVSSGSGKEVTVVVIDPNGNNDYIDQTTSGEGGIFRFEFTLFNQIEGTYTVKLGAVGVAKPYEAIFKYELPVPVTGVSLDKEEATLTIGEILQLTATVEPENATNKAVTWSSSNESVATVDQNGIVTAVGAGTAIITVTTVEGGFTATCTITVKEAPTVVTISDVTVKVDPETGRITVEGKVSSGSGQYVAIVVYTPDDDIDYIGQTTSGADGKFVFVYTSRLGIKGTYTVKLGAVGLEEPYETTFEYDYEVTVPVTGVSLDKEKATLKIGDILQLTAKVEPENATNQAVIWSSSNENVATVENGVVTAVGVGTAIITVTTVDGGFTASCTITVEEAPTEVTISDVTVRVDYIIDKVIVEGKVSSGSGQYVSIQVLDPNGFHDFIGQTTSKEDGKFTFVFTLNVKVQGGIYTVKLGARGLAEPYVTTFKYEHEVTVPVTGVSLDKEEATLKIGDTLKLTATVEPENATNKAVTWSSSNEQVAIVDQDGVVTAVGAGTAIITVTTADGGFTDTCIITVEEEVPVVIISDVTVEVDPETGMVIVEGKVSSGSNKEVTIRVYNPEGEIDYVSQTTSMEDGKFRFVFTPRTEMDGTYVINIAALGVEEPFETTFEYVVSKKKPFEIIPVGSLERVGGIWATVNVKRVEGTPDHEGQEVVVFQLMKGSTPMTITAVKQDITSELTVTVMFNVLDPGNEEYTVEVFVFNKFDSDTGTAPIILAESKMMN
ncbi:MAG: hypothetical protein GX066_03435, partial [Clostridiaceae bacterium]|nr:hypothetical protein [Clostridiaceae bacterium]